METFKNPYKNSRVISPNSIKTIISRLYNGEFEALIGLNESQILKVKENVEISINHFKELAKENRGFYSSILEEKKSLLLKIQYYLKIISVNKESISNGNAVLDLYMSNENAAQWYVLSREINKENNRFIKPFTYKELAFMYYYMQEVFLSNDIDSNKDFFRSILDYEGLTGSSNIQSLIKSILDTKDIISDIKNKSLIGRNFYEKNTIYKLYKKFLPEFQILNAKKLIEAEKDFILLKDHYAERGKKEPK